MSSLVRITLLTELASLGSMVRSPLNSPLRERRGLCLKKVPALSQVRRRRKPFGAFCISPNKFNLLGLSGGLNGSMQHKIDANLGCCVDRLSRQLNQELRGMPHEPTQWLTRLPQLRPHLDHSFSGKMRERTSASTMRPGSRRCPCKTARVLVDSPSYRTLQLT